MANDGFKGTTVLIERLELLPGPGGIPLINVSVQFASAEGTVHAVAQHSFQLDPEMPTDGLAQVAKDLLKAVTKKVEAAHFNRPNEGETTIMKGIAEALRAIPEAPDEPGTQG